jgi:hypothetical protein
MKKTKNSYFVKLPEDFKVEVPGKEELFEMNPSGIYMTWDSTRLWIHYMLESKQVNHMQNFKFLLPLNILSS